MRSKLFLEPSRYSIETARKYHNEWGTTKHMITTQNLTKSYKGHLALDDVTLTFNEGMVGLLGPNGAGKTTFLRVMATLQKPTSGSASIFGVPLSQPEEVRRQIGYLPQHFSVYPQLTGREFLDYVGVMKGIHASKTRQEEIECILDQVNLTDKADKKVRTYSGGMRQRLGIAQALLGSPKMLIVDEPTAGLDPEERVRFRNILTRFSVGRIVLLSTHIVADIESNCRQIAVLSKGQLVLSGELSDLADVGDGKVWQAVLNDEELRHIDPMVIVSTQRLEEGVSCRIISDVAPHPAAMAVKPTLEDGYLALLGRERHA
ncbi:ABC transporter ATP-binding protein [Paenibacillus urinalis]|uniref:ABC transporter ATP-binding protein n=1 Tax=Paenibacillus urinalis TaxID=521520 RepID=UPI003635A296